VVITTDTCEASGTKLLRLTCPAFRGDLAQCTSAKREQQFAVLASTHLAFDAIEGGVSIAKAGSPRCTTGRLCDHLAAIYSGKQLSHRTKGQIDGVLMLRGNAIAAV
jgi:hypothetical protein